VQTPAVPTEKLFIPKAVDPSREKGRQQETCSMNNLQQAGHRIYAYSAKSLWLTADVV
jgi:hypothetical protein